MTTPVPAPDFVTVTAYCATSNVAVTDAACASVTSHVGFVPVHAPVHPANTEPVPGTAVSVTTVSGSKSAEHDAVVHVMPAGDDVTVPLPAPLTMMLSV